MGGSQLQERALWLARHVLPHEPALRRYLAAWRLPAGLDLEDVVQEAYARLASLESVADIREPGHYLFQVARSIILAHVRRSRVVSISSVADLEQMEIASDAPTPEVEVSDREQLHQLAVAVAELPEPSRSAFVLRVIHELPHREIGLRLGLSENAVQKMIARSIKFLMNRIGRGGNGARHASTSTGQASLEDRPGHAPFADE
jgi:RNA polymerase sigma-70 factor (ECF subfamily)